VRVDKPVTTDPKQLVNAEVAETSIVTSVGRIVVNDVLSNEFPFVNASLKDKDLNRLTSELIRRVGVDAAAMAIDKIKNLGFEYATRTGVTWSMDDIAVPKDKEKIVTAAGKRAEAFRQAFEDGLMSADERRRHISNIWKQATSEVAELVPLAVGKESPVYAIIESGARGSWGQIRQVAGMKGPVVNPAGETMEVPIISSFTEGFNVLEYFISTHGARKGSTDTALRTATAGYLTRRLVDVSQEVVVIEEDCKTKEGITAFRADSKRTGQDFAARLLGRVLAEDLKDGRRTIAKKGDVLDEDISREIDTLELEEVIVRSPLVCKSKDGVCQVCYGWDLGRNDIVQMGEAVGIVAAQAIGEPGTQLTMRTFHTGGVATDSDITHGLLRVEEIFEARPPKGQAVLVEVDGKIKSVRDEGLDRIVTIKESGPKGETEEVTVPREAELLVREGDTVAKGDQLTKGSIDLKELFRLAGQRTTERYIMREVQSIYAVSGAVINDKHIEIMIRQMLSRVRVKEGGGTVLAAGEIIPRTVFERMRAEAKEAGNELPEASTILLGITTAALASDSFLAAASFQETSRVLIRAALEGSIDPLARLKENIVIGRLIPAGTGYRREFAADAYVGTVPEQPDFGLEDDPALAEFALVASESEGGDFPAEAPLDSEEKAEQVKEAIEENE
jgi:DNA-directed RNA polymerase subunit beta'